MIVRGMIRHTLHVIVVCIMMMGALAFISGIGRAASDVEGETVPVAAVVTIVAGEVQLFRSGVADVSAVCEGMDVFVGDELTTAGDGDVELQLGDGSVLKIGPSSHVVIIEVNVVEVTGLSNTVIELVSGKLRALVAPLVSEESSYSIRSENVTVGVRGTDFGMSYDPENDVLEAICLEGKLEVSSLEWLERGFEPIIIIPGEGVTVEGGIHPGRSKSRSNRAIRGFFSNMGFQGPRGIEGAPDGLLGPLGPDMGVNPDALGVEGLEEDVNKALDSAPSGLGGGLDGLDGRGGGLGGGGRGGF